MGSSGHTGPRGGEGVRKAAFPLRPPGRRLPWGWMLLGFLLVLALGVATAVLLTSGGGRGSAPEVRVGPRVTPGGTPDFALPTVSWSGGREFVLSQNLGRPTVLYFVAGWCASCIPETQAWGRIVQEVGDRVNVLVISPDPSETEERLLRFKRLARVGDGLLWAMDKGGRLSQALGVVSLDTTIVLDGEGREVYRDGVPTPYSRLRQVLEPLLGGWP